MKFPGTCLSVKKRLKSTKLPLWAKGLGVKHQACAEVMQLKCIVCGGPAGCPDCEFAENCDLMKVSQMCICKKCSDEQRCFFALSKFCSKTISYTKS